MPAAEAHKKQNASREEPGVMPRNVGLSRQFGVLGREQPGG